VNCYFYACKGWKRRQGDNGGNVPTDAIRGYKYRLGNHRANGINLGTVEEGEIRKREVSSLPNSPRIRCPALH